MSLSFTDIPRFVAPEAYQQTIDRMVERLKTFPGIISIYQVGGVSTPGISDIDLLVVFSDDIKVQKNPIENLSSNDQYLFTHNLFGASESFVKKMEQYTFFGQYRLLHGTEQDIKQLQLNPEEENIVKKQVALEYLVKAFMTSTIEHAYHTIKLRNLFLHAKALLIDLSFLGIEKGKLSETIHEIMHVRNGWFHHPLSHKNLNYLALKYHNCLVEELPLILAREKFYLPAGANLQVSRNIRIKPSEEFRASSEGIFFPKTVMKVHHKLPRLLNKMNQFGFHIPVQKDPIPSAIMKRYEFISAMVRYQKSHLRNFIPTAFGLNIFNEKEI
jgi:hypothetical protein